MHLASECREILANLKFLNLLPNFRKVPAFFEPAKVNHVRWVWLSFAEDVLISEITELESLLAQLEGLKGH